MLIKILLIYLEENWDEVLAHIIVHNLICHKYIVASARLTS